MYPFFKFFGVNIPVFNLIIGLSLILGFLIYEDQEKVFNNDVFIKRNKELIFVITIISSFVFAALFENFYHRDFSLIGKYGITFYGGVLMSLLVNFCILKFSIKRLVLLINFSLPALVFAHAIGRIGCFFAGCCYGKHSDNLISIVYPNGERRIPTQLIESFLLFLLFWVMFKKVNFKLRFLFYFISYPVIRFTIEFFRDDDRGSIFGYIFSPSQYISILLIFFALIVHQKYIENTTKL